MLNQDSQILSINVNNKKTLICIGTQKGFEIYSFFTFALLRKKEFSGGVGPIDVLETSNIIAMTGGGLFPYFPPNKLVIWDDDQEKIKGEIIFKNKINAIRFKYEYVFVVADYKIFVYNLFENLALKIEVGTLFNPKGKIELNSIDSDVIFAYTTNKELTMIQEEQGQICVMNLTKGSSPITISAHNSKIKSYRLNYMGTLLATASVKGTLIRIFNTQSGKKLKEVRRGYESTSIYSIDFDYFDSFLVCVSKQDSVHIWKLNLGDQHQKKWFSKLIPIMDNKEEGMLRIQGMKWPLVFFDHNSLIWVISKNGSYQRLEFDTKKSKLKILLSSSLFGAN